MNSVSHSLRFPGPAAFARAYSAARGALALVGLVAVAAWVALPTLQSLVVGDSPDSQSSIVADSSPDASVTPAPAAVAAGQIKPDTHRVALEQKALTDFIARRYRVANEAVSRFVAEAYRAGNQLAVDPLLILSVMAVESGYNPVAKSTVGAMGLMQVVPRFHLDKLSGHGGEPALLDPDVNIFVGAQILREYLHRFGNVREALQMYGGAVDEPTAQYASKVLAEKARLEALKHKLEH